MEFSTYKVPSRKFNLIFETADYQGDGLFLVAIILFHRGFKLEHWTWNAKSPFTYRYYSLFK